jgi:hypothetical protein
MKKIILLSLLFISCSQNRVELKPIEFYRNKGIIVLEEPYSQLKYPEIVVKNKDSVFTIKLAAFDAKNLKVGDTIK